MLDVFFILFFNYFLYSLIVAIPFKKKAANFIGLIFTIAVLGFYFSFDGFVMLLLGTEFVVVVLLILLSLTSGLYAKKYTAGLLNLSIFNIVCFIIYLAGMSDSKNAFTYTTRLLYSSTSEIYASDLFIFFYTFFLAYPAFVLFLTLLLSFFTIFFILYYTKSKSLLHKNEIEHKALSILRKQSSVKQARFKSQLSVYSRK